MVRVHHPHPSLGERLRDGVKRHMGAPPLPEAIGAVEKLGFENRLNHLSQRLLDHGSRTAGTPSGRCPPLALGMYTRLTGCGR